MRRTERVEVVRPADLGEALEQLAEGGRPLLGGTDLWVRVQRGVERPTTAVYLGDLPELQGWTLEGGRAQVGAAVTHDAFLCSPLAEAFPILRDAISTIGGPAIRAMGTLAGNVANASPAADTLVPLYLLEAEVRIVGPEGERTLPVEKFVQGPGKTVLQPGELIHSLSIPLPPEGAISWFRKVGRRRALYIAIVSMGALLWLDDGRVRRARIALGSVAPTVLRARAVETGLEGRGLRPSELQDLSALLGSLTQPISDLRAPATYRSRVAGRLLLAMAEELGSTDTGEHP